MTEEAIAVTEEAIAVTEEATETAGRGREETADRQEEDTPTDPTQEAGTGTEEGDTIVTETVTIDEETTATTVETTKEAGRSLMIGGTRGEMAARTEPQETFQTIGNLTTEKDQIRPGVEILATVPEAPLLETKTGGSQSLETDRMPTQRSQWLSRTKGRKRKRSTEKREIEFDEYLGQIISEGLN